MLPQGFRAARIPADVSRAVSGLSVPDRKKLPISAMRSSFYFFSTPVPSKAGMKILSELSFCWT